MGGLTDASQCRVIAENGLGVTLICQHHVYTGCTSPAITTDVTTRILIRQADSCVYTSACPSPPNFNISRLCLYQPRMCHRSQHVVQLGTWRRCTNTAIVCNAGLPGLGNTSCWTRVCKCSMGYTASTGCTSPDVFSARIYCSTNTAASSDSTSIDAASSDSTNIDAPMVAATVPDSPREQPTGCHT